MLVKKQGGCDFNHGFSIAEMLIAAVILFGALALGLKVFLGASTEQIKGQKRLEMSNALNLFSGTLQKNMATGDTRFAGFTGKGPPGGGNDETFGRALVPFAGRCADLTNPSGICDQDDAFLYVDYNKTTAPSVTALCIPDLANPTDIILDLNDTSWGDPLVVAPTPTIITVTGGGTFPSGPIDFSANNTIAGFNSVLDHVPIWQTVGGITSAAASTTGAVITIAGQSSGAGLNPACINNLPQGMATTGAYLNNLRKVAVRPWIMKDATNGTTVSNAEKISAFGMSKVRIFQVNLRTLGRYRNAATSKDSFIMAQCKANATGQVDCSAGVASPILQIDNISKARLEMAFYLEIYDAAGAAIGADRYTLNAAAPYTALASCTVPTCGFLPWSYPVSSLGGGYPNPAANPHLEIASKLDGTQFSLLKMDKLKRLQFIMNDNSPEKKEYSFNVLF